VHRMKRKQVCLDPNQARRLRALSGDWAESESELTREGVDRVLKEPLLDRSAWERELTFIDSLIPKGPLKGRRNVETARSLER
jgi:hypothetical protein